jgi:hypothetical protein
MYEIELGELLDQAEAEGSLKGSGWPKGRMRLELAKTRVGTTRDKKHPELGFMWRCTEGEFSGQVEWENIKLDKTNKVSVQIFFEKFLALGVTREFMRTNPSLEQLCGMVEGSIVDADYEAKPWKSDATKSSNSMRVVKIIDTDTPEDNDDDTILDDFVPAEVVDDDDLF